MSMFRNLVIASQLDSALTFNIVAAEGADVLNIKTRGVSTLMIDWGDGSPLDLGTPATHTYAAGEYTLRLCAYTPATPIYVILFDGSNVNIRSSNERWSAIYGLSVVSFQSCSNAECAFTSLPNGVNSTYSYTSAFYNCTNALLPIRSLPLSTTSIQSFAYNNQKALLPFNELPPGLAGNHSGMFYNCREATYTITHLPDGITGLNNAFNNNKKATLRLSSLPPNITSMSLTFESSSLVMDLDEVAANAPDGGYAALTNLNSTFYGCSGVTGSRSRFLAACPNATTNNYTFAGTSTTE